MKRLYIIELLRFIAASAIGCIHINNIFFYNSSEFHFLESGIDLFFVISGFVMMLSAENNPNQFFLKRVIRIIPTYYFFTICVFLISLTIPNLLNNTSPNIVHLIKSFFFIPFNKNGIGHFPVLYLGWTLNYEMYFYLLFSLALLLNRKKSDFIVTGLLSSIYLILRNTSLPFIVYSQNIVFNFVLGIFIYRVFYSKNYIRAFFILMIPIFTLSINNDFNGRFYNHGILSAIIVLFSLYLFSKVKFPKLVSILGGYSYAFYLIHPFIFIAFKKLANPYVSNQFLLFLSIFSFFSASLISYYFWKLVEIPVTKYLRTKYIT